MLILAIILCAIAVAGVWKSSPRNPLGILVFFPALIAQQFTMYLLAIAAALLIWAFLSVNSDKPAVPVMVLAAISAQCSWLTYRRALATASVLMNALTDTAAPAKAPRLPAGDRSLPSGWKPLALKTAENEGRVERLSDIAYADRGERGLLDIYRPSGTKAAAGLPILIHIHGGAWVSGSKTQQGLPLMHYLCEQGWLCVAINYRLSPTHRFPAHLDDVLTAMHWIHENADKYGGNGSSVSLAGGSAGGHLGSLAALLLEHPDREKWTSHLPILTQSLPTIDAVVPLYGRFDFVDRAKVLGMNGVQPMARKNIMPQGIGDEDPLWDLASPVAMVHAKAPPFFIIHGTLDGLVPIPEAEYFYQQLSKVSQSDTVFAPLPGAQHAFDLCNTPWSIGMAEAVHGFLSRYQLKR